MCICVAHQVSFLETVMYEKLTQEAVDTIRPVVKGLLVRCHKI